ncbi:MAG: 30S ribosomal protein S4e [Candidatus Kariarchaeaceae archaeon]|jgi:small subunit ribosomal protein S4e
MTKAGKRQHQKRTSSPRTWPINRKKAKQMFVPKISPGPHGKEMGMPLLVLLRDVLGVSKNSSETKKILSSRKVRIDGRVRSNEKFPVGHMDVVEFDGLDEKYRVQIHTSHRLLPFTIDEGEASYKICKVTGKRNVRGGDTQISLHDGRNILIKEGREIIDEIKGQHSVKIAVPSQEILDVLPLEEGARAMVTEGRHQGKIGKIISIERRYGPKASEVTFEDEANDEVFRTALDYVFVLSEDIELQR